MKPIILLGILAVVIVTFSSGFLFPTFDINVQNLGVGDADFESPIDNAGVDLKIEAISFGEGQETIFKNKITSCSFHTGDALEFGLEAVICKITTTGDKVIGEARLNFCDNDLVQCPQGHFVPSTAYYITDLEEAYPGALNMDNVYDIKIIVLGANPVDQP